MNIKKISLLISIIFIFSSLTAGAAEISRDAISGKITITASDESFKNQPVFIQIIPADADIDSLSDTSYALSNVLYWAQGKADADGSFTIDNISLSESGDMIVRIKPQNLKGDAVTEEFTTYSKADIDSAWALFKGDKSESAIASGIANALKVLDVKNDVKGFEARLAKLVYSKGTFGDLNETNLKSLADFIDESMTSLKIEKSALDSIANAENYSEIKKIVNNADNAKALGIEELLDRYNDLKSTASVDKAIIKETFADAESFAERFEELIEKAEKDENTGSKPSGTTGNKGNNGSVGGGAGGSVGASAPDKPIEINPVPEITCNFTDIDSVEWAKEAIITLYSKGMINGKSDASFAPNDYITREELVKLIVVAASISVKKGGLSFADTDDSAWYADYIASAVEAGLINGLSNDTFGVGVNISRQDMAVIFDRALSYKNIAKSEAADSFADEALFADYAKDAIYNLNAKGIITGDGTGNFNPAGNATRAEAACMLYRFINQ